ncbi:B-cell receptor CD22 isoform X2 [Nycticebus coucang]|uniref:B-cell receptor CD22 isoform X2 n=1 Tax=Nycticebus coucang TaxID=9470 RepID=UPI00234E080F|nr:B-cell receptor CD22 isoform X2 [Nycticebus coucang]
MHRPIPWLLLLVSMASSDVTKWKVTHPDALYAWAGACVWIPCEYRTVMQGENLDNVTVYLNPEFIKDVKAFTGHILYNTTKVEEAPSQQGRVQFLGDGTRNCTLSINPVWVNDSGQLGLRMMTRTEKWMEKIPLNVSEKPLVPQIQLPSEIRESETVTLTCLLNFACYEKAIRLQWTLNEGTDSVSRSISVANIFTKSQLTFQPRWEHHGKNVSCQLWGEEERQVLSQQTVQLNVKHLPKLKIQVSPSEPTVKEGESVNMMCKVVSSNPESKDVSWYKDGALKSAQRTLTLPAVAKEDSGKYWCQASSALGTNKSEEVALEVQYAPEPSRVQILPLPATEGKNIEMTCISPANPPPTNYTWYHNRNEVLGKTEKKFQIPKVFLGHAGTYSCLAENILGIGKIGQGAKLDVHYHPRNVTVVIQNPTPIREGDSVTLSCNYTSSNPAVTYYKWDPRGAWTEPSPGVLLIQKVAWNVKNITCTACNDLCSLSHPVSLNVHYAPRDVRVLQTSPTSEVHSGHRVVLQCEFSSSYPREVRYIWKKNGGSFLGEGKQLTFDSVSPEDAGNYSCSVNNSIGQTASEARRLQVLYAPRRLRVSMTPANSMMEGQKAALTCESDANPPVSQYTWFDWNNQNLPHTGQTLRLAPLKVQHSGAYRCQGSNRLGVGQSPPSTLTVYYSPETIGRRVATGLGLCLAALILVIFGVKLRRSWKKIQSQQGLQENSSGQSFFVRNKKVRRAPLSEGHHVMGCCNPVMEDSVNYATLRFPETDTTATGDAETSAAQRLHQDSSDMVTYSVLQRPRVGDYENVSPDSPEDEGIHYSELIQFGVGQRPRVQENVEYVTLKH